MAITRPCFVLSAGCPLPGEGADRHGIHAPESTPDSRAFLRERRNNAIFEIQGLEHLVPGTPVAFTDRLTIGEETLSGQLDNVLTVAHLVHLFDHGFRGTACFTAQEESGSSWRFLMEWIRRRDTPIKQLIVVDTSPFAEAGVQDLPDLVLRTRDANAAFDPALQERLETLCRGEGLSFVYKDRYIEELDRRAEPGTPPRSVGSTEMGRVIAASAGSVQGATLQIPTLGYHTLAETASIRSNEAFFRLLQLLAEEGIQAGSSG